jgi:tyrosine-protein phosphatase MSG5
MSLCQIMEADSPLKKRSFDTLRDPNIYHQSYPRKRSDGEAPPVKPPSLISHQNSRTAARRSLVSRSLAMPAPTSPPVSLDFPSFMSVFGGEMGRLEEDKREDHSLTSHSRGQARLISRKPLPHTHHHSLSERDYHRDTTVDSVESDSSTSSPTTTVSTFDSPSVTDPSPSSSPESPSSLLPPSSFPEDKAMDQPLQDDGLGQQQPGSESPVSKERNVKNLSLNMNLTSLRPVTASTVEGSHPFSAPTSPLRAPLKTGGGRRKPNNLTIQTPGFDRNAFSAGEIPPTPGHRPFLKHHGSSPGLPSTRSPTTGPSSGMQLPPASLNRLLSRPGSDSSISSLSGASSQCLHDLKEEEAELEQPKKSHEAPECGYPDGPICIYDGGLHLYLEPSREEASQFDTVINVAKEVANPFATTSSTSEPLTSVMSVWRNCKPSESPEPRTAVSDISFKSALEWPESTSSSSAAAAVGVPSPQPEYIHAPWDHNSEILDDLYPLCQLIDDRLSQGKSVLVHCQLGVSRSASLVIAYGIYKGFKTDFHSMYTVVKDRSRWVGPNMSLIYQLMDFRAKMANGECAAAARSKPASQPWLPRASTDTEMTPRPPIAPSPSKSIPQMPDRAGVTSVPSNPPTRSLPPLPLSSGEASSTIREVSLPIALSQIALKSPSNLEPVSESLITSPTLDAPPIPQRSVKRYAPRPFPLREQLQPPMGSSRTPSVSQGRIGQCMSLESVISSSPLQMDLVMQEMPASPAVFSPRTTEFRGLSIGMTDAGDLASDKPQTPPLIRPAHTKRISVFAAAPIMPVIDPRSPHHGDEAGETIRNIDDVL